MRKQIDHTRDRYASKKAEHKGNCLMLAKGVAGDVGIWVRRNWCWVKETSAYEA
jgi:hypothetical protein